MTYNFDPDRWLANELAALDVAFKSGRLNDSDYDRRKDRLLGRYDEMVARLDGTYRINED